MNYHRMTAMQLYRALSENKYIVVRDADGRKCAVNCKLCLMIYRDEIAYRETNWVSFYPASLHEYITHKVPMALDKFQESKSL